MASAQTRVLISGNGIATQTLTWWLQHSNLNFHITVVERAPKFRDNGQGIDVRSLGVELLRKMGIEDQVRANVTHEKGWDFVDQHSRPWASFPASDNAASLTSDIEISRGDFIKLLAKNVPQKVDVRYSTVITALDEHTAGVDVTFDSGTTETYDLVVGADGSGSGVRRILHEKGEVHGVAPANATGRYDLRSIVGLWSMPKTAADSTSARTFLTIGGRSAHIRPATHDTMAVMLVTVDGARREELHRVTRLPYAEAKEWFRREYGQLAWPEIHRILASIDAAPDFYVQDLAQVFVDRWSSAGGRIALVGDAASCPGPITGHGTTNALYTAYMYARSVSKELRAATRAARAPHWAAAAHEFEHDARPYVARCQRTIPGAPDIANPKTEWGLFVLRCLGRAASFAVNNFGGLFSWIASWWPKSRETLTLHSWEA